MTDSPQVVPLVTYGADGTRTEIGSAEVRADGSVFASIDRIKAPAGLVTEHGAGFSFGLGRPPAERDEALVDALAEVRAENRRLRREVGELAGQLREQLEQARVMRADVAELARQAGVLLEGQVDRS